VYEEYHVLPGGDDDTEEAAELVGEALPAWTAALARRRDLLIVRDGGR
jgi:hypothetical protein